MPKISTVSTKGQVTIPNYLRSKYGIQEGTNVVFIAIDQNTIMLKIVNKEIVSLYVETPTESENTLAKEVKRKIPISVKGATL